MRILLCSNFYYRRGGDCTYLLALQALLEKHGHETAVFSMRHPQNRPCPQEKYFVDFLDYAELNRRKNPLNAVRVLGRSIWSRQARQNVARLIADWKPDIAHLQNVHAYLTPSILGPLEAAGVPVAWTLHDYKLICPNDNFFSNGRVCEECKGGRFWRCAWNRCKKGSRAASAVAVLEAFVHRHLDLPSRIAAFVAPSEFLKNKFVEFGWPADKIHVLPNFLPEMPPAIAPPPEGHGLYLGTLLPTKGVDVLLRALAKAPPHPFHILGAGAERSRLENLAEERGLSGQVRFGGFLRGAEWDREVAGASYAVMPSVWYENGPYAAMELMARGIPLIAAAIGGIPELVRHEETGLLFPPGDAAGLAFQLARLQDNPALRAELGGRAREFILRRCDPEAYYAALADLYGRQLGISSIGQESQSP